MDAFMQWAVQNNWQVALAETEREMPEWAFRRYAKLPGDYVRFLRWIHLLANQSDTSWFLSIDYFMGSADAVWQHDSFEKISLEACGRDEKQRADVARFWDAHIPIVFCLSNGYEYYAIRLEDGAVVTGAEPEFEETSVTAQSFQAFLGKVMAGEISL